MRFPFISSVSIVLIMSLMASCAGTSQKNKETEAVNLNDSIIAQTLSINTKDLEPISNNLEKIDKIIFDEDVENIMGLPQSIEVRGDSIFAVESYQAPGIFLYLKNGTQLWAYCSTGGGAEDISSPFNLNVTDKEISFFDMGASKIGILDKSGKYINTISLNPSVRNAIIDEDGGIWADYTNQSHETTLLSYRSSPDSDENEVLSVPESVKGITTSSLRSLTPLYDGSINYLPSMQPRVYSLKDGKAFLKYEFDFGSLWPDDEIIKRDFTGDSWARKIKDFPIRSLKLDESKSWLTLAFTHNDKKYLFIYNKDKNIGTTFIDEEQEYYCPMTLKGDTLYLLSKDNSIVGLRCQ